MKKDINPSPKPLPAISTSKVPDKPTAPVVAESVAPKGWKEWAIWADKLRPVGDGQGHGPDVGSDEWASALDRQLKISDAEGHGPDVGSGEWRTAVERVLLKR